MILGTLFELISVALVIPLISIIGSDDLKKNENSLDCIITYIGNPSKEYLIILVLVLMLLIYIIKSFYLIYSYKRQADFIYGFSTNISASLFRNFLLQPYSFHLNVNSSELVRTVTHDCSMLASFVQSMTILISEIFVLVGLLITLIIVEPYGTLITFFLIVSTGWFFTHRTRKKISFLGEKNQFHGALRYQHLEQGLSSVKDLKILGREDQFIQKYNFHSKLIANYSAKNYTVTQMPRLLIEVITILGLVVFVTSMIFTGKSLLVILPTLGFLVVSSFRLMPSVNRIVNSIQTIIYTVPSINIIHKSLTTSEVKVRGLVIKREEFIHEIEFRDVSFKYSSSTKYNLNKLSISILKGETIGVIGASGAGKSTFIDIFLGILPPTSGVIYMDNNDIQSNLRNWQDQLGYVPQSIYLTDDSIRSNIAFGVPEELIDEVKVARAVKASQLERFINSQEHGLATVVGERGVRLSGGERQRIGMARALYHDPNVLVFDEATSALDTETESQIMAAIENLRGKKTIVIVAHRLNTLKNCDRIFRFENGKIISSGSPLDILKKLN
jgi:ABC-type multidrug transport system fused ATPase/permease subunit